MISRLIFLDEIVHPYIQYVQLAASVRREDGSEIADTHHGGTQYERRYKLYHQHDLVRRTESRVDDLFVRRACHGMHGKRLIVDDDLHGIEGSRRAEEQLAALHDYRADAADGSAHLGVVQHHLAIHGPLYDLPVCLHVLYAIANVAAVLDQHPVTYRAHDPMNQ